VYGILSMNPRLVSVTVKRRRRNVKKHLDILLRGRVVAVAARVTADERQILALLGGIGRFGASPLGCGLAAACRAATAAGGSSFGTRSLIKREANGIRSIGPTP
jgi:hypothetical protein